MADVRPLGVSVASGQSFGSYGDFVYVAVCNRHQWRIIEQFGGAGNVEQLPMLTITVTRSRSSALSIQRWRF